MENKKGAVPAKRGARNKGAGGADAGVGILERLFDEENDENIILFDTNGKEIELEQVAAVSHEGGIYAVLHAVGDPEDEVLVFRVDPEDEESIVMVDDEALGNKILAIVMENAGK